MSGARKLSPEPVVSSASAAEAPAVEAREGPYGQTWVVRSHELARRLIRAEDSVAQAGFGAQSVTPATPRRRRPTLRVQMRPPILYLEGTEHRQRRKAAARHFAPKVTESYRAQMDQLAAELVAPVAAGRRVDLSELTLAMAVQVAAQVVGLTNSSVAGMSRRLDAFFAGDPTTMTWRPRGLVTMLRAQTALLRFHWFDVRPAIRARRRRPSDDVISQLVEAGYSPLEILTECVTYGAAGMATTREFISVAAWHLLDDPELLARYRAHDREGRIAVLQEVLRLEPVVGHLYRRTTAPVIVPHHGRDHELPVGTMIDFDLRAINVDAGLVGADGCEVVPGRPLERGVAPAVLSFGDGNHRCPGAPIAIMESEILLSELFAHDVTADGPPAVSWNKVTQGYELRRFWLRLA